MSSFTTPLICKYIDGQNWEIVEDFCYHVGEYPSLSIITVEQHFITDFASIPRIFHPIVSPTGEHGKAAVIHDWLYRTHQCSRKVADDIFLEAMQVLGVSWWKRIVMYKAVRWFGSSSYNQMKGKISYADID